MRDLNRRTAIHEVTDLAERNRLDEIQHRLAFRQAEGVSADDGEFLIEIIDRMSIDAIEKRNQAYSDGRQSIGLGPIH